MITSHKIEVSSNLSDVDIFISTDSIPILILGAR